MVKAIKLGRKSYQITLSDWVEYDEFYLLGQYFLPTSTF